MKTLKWICFTLALVMLAASAASGTLANTGADSQTLEILQTQWERVDNGDSTTDGNLRQVATGRQLMPATESLSSTEVTLEFNGTVKAPLPEDNNEKPIDVTVSFTDKAAMISNGSALDHIVVVSNHGNTEAYVRTWFAFELGDLSLTQFQDYVQLNRNGEWIWKDEYQTKGTENTWVNGWQVVEIEGQKYAVTYATYRKSTSGEATALAQDATTTPSLYQIYLASNVTNEMAEKLDGNGDGCYSVLVTSVAVSDSDAFSEADPWTKQGTTATPGN